MLNYIQNRALYPVLQHYTGSQISKISNEGEKTVFDTYLGQHGYLLEDYQGDWEIIIEDEIVEKIEKEVFDILIKPSNKSTLEDYLEILSSLMKKNIKHRSKLLVGQMLKVLEDYIIQSDYTPKKPIIISPFVVSTVCGKKTINCLN